MRSEKKRIKILHTIRQGKIGGGETHVLDLVSNLSDEFYSEVLAFTPGEMVNVLEERGVKCHVIHTEKPFDLRVWRKVKQLISENGYEVVHAHGTRACSNSFWSTNKLGLPLLYTIHGWSFHKDQSNMVRSIRERSEKYLVNKTDVNISVSQSNNKDGIERIGMPNSVVVNNGVNTDKFNPYNPSILKRKEFNLPEGKTIVGMLARLTIQKDPVTFVKAAAEVCQMNQDAHFLIVGGGELEEECKSLATELKIDDQISFHGFRTDVPEILKLIDIYCLPSLWEGLPIGILEAMAMEKAIVATPVDGTKEVIFHGESGLLFPEYDYKAMANCILQLIKEPDLRMRLGMNARSMINNSFGVRRMADELGILYKKVISEKLTEA